MQIKKRIFVTIILTIILIILSNPFWLIFKPVSFELYVNANDNSPIIIKTVVNRKNDNEFKKTYKLSKEINFEISNHYKVNFDKPKVLKRLRLEFSGLVPNNQYEISRISFKNGKYKLQDFSRFNADNAKLKIENDKLIIVPTEQDITLTYDKNIFVRPPVKFDIRIFLIIGICSFLLLYKLTSYLADFKINKNASRLDIVFLVICGMLLFLPMFNINQVAISKKENRRLAIYHPLISKDNKINYNFGKDYDAWISDRFGLRNILIDTYSNLKYNITTRYYITQKAYLDKKTNWMFLLPLIHSTFSDYVLDKSIKGLNNFNKFCNDNDIKFYLLLIPVKEDIYVKETFSNLEHLDTYKDAVDKLRASVNVPIIYPHKELLEASKNDYVFFKTDHHLTDYGTYVAYQLLMDEIKKDFSIVKTVQISDFDISQNKKVRKNFDRIFQPGNTFNAVNLNPNKHPEIFDTQYNFYYHKNRDFMKIDAQNIPYFKQKRFEYPYGSNLKLFLAGNSMNYNLSDIISYNFKSTYFMNLNETIEVKASEHYKLLKRYKKQILDYKPDIIVLCTSASLIPYLKDLVNED